MRRAIGLLSRRTCLFTLGAKTTPVRHRPALSQSTSSIFIAVLPEFWNSPSESFAKKILGTSSSHSQGCQATI